MNAEQAWKERAICGDLPPQEADRIFYPNPKLGRPPNSGRVDVFAEAKAICANCPVTLECLQEGLEVDEEFEIAWGVFGGLDPADRAALRARKGGVAA